MSNIFAILMTIGVVFIVVLIAYLCVDYSGVSKNTNDKLRDIGFKLVNDDKHSVTYERYNEDYNYTHVLTIVHKNNGRHIIQSYDKDLFDEKKIGNTNVGLTYYESKLIMKKMREKGWKSK